MKRIGFKNYDEAEAEEVVEVKAETSPPTTTTASFPITHAQLNLHNNIRVFSDIITGEEFVKFSPEQKNNYVNELINLVSLNAELNVKTLLLSSK
jgi:hypothetical protein